MKLHVSLKDTKDTNRFLQEVDIVDILNNLFLISLDYIITCLPFYNFLLHFVILGIESIVLGSYLSTLSIFYILGPTFIFN